MEGECGFSHRLVLKLQAVPAPLSPLPQFFLSNPDRDIVPFPLSPYNFAGDVLMTREDILPSLFLSQVETPLFRPPAQRGDLPCAFFPSMQISSFSLFHHPSVCFFLISFAEVRPCSGTKRCGPLFSLDTVPLLIFLNQLLDPIFIPSLPFSDDFSL